MALRTHTLALALPDSIEERYSAESEHVEREVVPVGLVGLRLYQLMKVLKISVWTCSV